MKAVEFCYWLQGMFELNPPTALSAEQRTCIVNHLRLVKVAEPKHTNAFVRWLDLYLPSAGERADLDAIQSTLAAQFQHVIDKSYAGSQAEMNAAHGAGGDYAPLMRC